MHAILISFYSIWSSDLLIPAYTAAASVVILILHRVFITSTVKHLWLRISSRGKYEPLDDDEGGPPEQPVASLREGVLNDLRAHIDSLGGIEIFVYKILRLAGCLTLVVLTIAILVDEEKARDGPGLLDSLKKKKHKGKKKPSHSDSFTDDEWRQIAMLLTYVCISCHTKPTPDFSAHPPDLYIVSRPSRCCFKPLVETSRELPSCRDTARHLLRVCSSQHLAFCHIQHATQRSCRRLDNVGQTGCLESGCPRYSTRYSKAICPL